jgi:signal transduction histidine kinase
LNTIIGFSRLLLKGANGSLSDLQRGDLVAIHKSGYRLSGLIDNVIALSELEGGATAIERQSVDLDHLLTEVLAVADRQLVDVTIDWHREETLPQVQGDRALLRQAFLGLVTTVAEQASSSQIVVRALRHRGSCKEDPCAVVLVIGGNGESAVRETAAGASFVLEPDEQVEDLGVSLALARQVIVLHRGWVQFQFEPDRGLESVVMLPADQGEWVGEGKRTKETGR